MTHTEISITAEERRIELITHSVDDILQSCVDPKFSKQDCSDTSQLICELNRSSGEIQYFSEATIAKQQDPIATAEKRIKSGMKMSGKIVDIASPPNWKELNIESRNFRYKMHAWLMLDTLLSADEKSDSNEYLQIAVNIADDWIVRHVMEGTHDEFAWYDMATGQRATKLAYMIRRMISINMPKEVISRFLLTCQLHIIELTQEDRIATHSNHGLFQMGGLIAICKSLPWLVNSESHNSFSIEILSKMLDQHFSSDGLHKEHSPEYHYFMVNHLSSFVDLGWITNTKLKQTVNLVEEACWSMLNPEKNVIAIGDSKNNLPAIERWDRASSELIEGIKVFPSGGLVVENASIDGHTSQLVFAAQFHSRQHKHADHLNVLYHLHNQPLLIDAGTYTYQYDLPERIYCESTRAHNTIEIDGLNYSRFRSDAFGSALTVAQKIGPCSVLQGQVHHTRLISSYIPNNKITSSDAVNVNIKHIRTIIHYPNRFLAIIDQMDSETIHDYVQWHHLSPDIAFREFTPDRYEIHKGDERLCVVFSEDADNNSLEAFAVIGQTEPHLQGWVSHNGIELIENPAVGFKSTGGGDSEFVTVFDFSMKNTGKPYLRSGSAGNYLRFAITQSGKKSDFKIRTKSDGSRTIEAIIDGEEFSVDLESNQVTSDK